MLKFKRLTKILSPVDFITICFGLFLSGLNILYHTRVETWYLLVGANVAGMTFIITVAHFKDKYGGIWDFINKWYMIPLMFLTFKELYVMIKPIRQVDLDLWLIEIDRILFGFDVTVVLYDIAHPVLTELLQISYGTFFLLPLILGVDLLVNKREEAFYFAAFSIVYGFFLSFYGYFLVPAIGPRFYLHDFHTINQELPGLLLTNFLRDMVNAGESLEKGMLNPEFFVQRDVFPSGHTQMTLIVMYLAYKLKTRSRYFLIPNGILLVFSTVYLRYHYLIDVVAGVLFMIFTMWTGYKIYNAWKKAGGKNEFDYENY